MKVTHPRRTILPSFAIWLTLIAVLPLDAQEPKDFAPTDLPRLLADLRTAPLATGSDPVLPYEMQVTRGPGAGNARTILFAATDDSHGQELWQLAPDESTRRLTDICPGPCSSMERYAAVTAATMSDGRVLVRADDGETGPQLWVTDGTESGSERLTQFPAGQFPQQLSKASLDGFHYFTTSMDRLWRTDGTPDGTTEFPVDPDSRNFSYPVRVGDRMVFIAYDETYSLQVWSTDGTAEGTLRLDSPCLGCSAALGDIAGLGEDATGAVERMVFTTIQYPGPRLLWTTAGTPETTEMLLDVCPATDGYCDFYNVELHPVGDRLAFPVNHRVYWTDGTTDGTQKVGEFEEFTLIQDLAPSPSGLLALTHTFGPPRVWSLASGSLPATPILVAELPETVYQSASIQPAGPFVFSTEDEETGQEVWASDGTSAGTRRLADIAPGPDSSVPYLFVPWNDSVLFTADDLVLGRELFISDGTEVGTRRLADLRGTPGGSDPREFVNLGNQVLFVADSSDAPRPFPYQELPSSGDLFAASSSGLPTPTLLLEARKAQGLTRVGDRVFFEAEYLEPAFYGSLDFEPWITDGTAAGTHLLAEIEPGSKRSYPRDPILLPTPDGERILFLADRGARGAKIWRSDGTPQGTLLVTDIDPTWDNVHPDEACNGICSPPYPESRIYPRDAHRLGDRVVFIGHDPDVGEELWITDGTASGTRVLIDVEPGAANSYPANLTVSGDRLFFSSGELPEDIEFTLRGLWVTDGSADGTHLLADDLGAVLGMVQLTIPSGAGVALLTHGDLDLGQTGYSLWISDGTAEGTERIATFDEPAGQLTAADDLAYFTLQSADRGTEPARTDGTAAGTFVLRDLRPGERGSSPRWLTSRGREAIFAATDGTSDDGGTDLWITNGDVGDARKLVTDGPRLQGPTAAHVTPNGRLLVAADDGLHGREPWTIGDDSGLPLCERSEFYHCLSQRFRIHVTWRIPATGQTGMAHTLPGTADTGLFWFFGSESVELAVKVLNGTAVNNHHWLFYGALSNVEYTIVAEDLLSGTQRTYMNPSGNLCGGSDVEAFCEPNFLHGVSTRSSSGATAEASRVLTTATAKTHTACGEQPNSLCLQDRFEVTATWQTDQAAGNALPIPFSDRSGMFWFFNPNNVELLVKVLDGRPVNGKFWVFYGALSNVEYTLRIVDTETGDEVSYFNPKGNLCGGSDIDAFDG